ncbi:MAG TPA: response regulator [Opitutaceae bacterium]|jgi:CheY-like chemotaxis protein|nr:response regulator [Opitutaceae bacterium]
MGDVPAKAALPVVLLVDDEPALLDAMSEELKSSFRIYTASSAAEADLRLAARHYDAIVCDHMLPGEQGLDFLGRMLEMLPSTKRILVTGYTSPEFITRSTAIAGLSACLVKPVRAAEIAKAVTDALAS